MDKYMNDNKDGLYGRFPPKFSKIAFKKSCTQPHLEHIVRNVIPRHDRWVAAVRRARVFKHGARSRWCDLFSFPLSAGGAAPPAPPTRYAHPLPEAIHRPPSPLP